MGRDLDILDRFGANPDSTHHHSIPFSSNQAACTRLLILSFCFSFTLPKAMANITTNAKPIRSFIFFCPRIKCCSKQKDTSNRLLTRSTDVRFLYICFQR